MKIGKSKINLIIKNGRLTAIIFLFIILILGGCTTKNNGSKVILTNLSEQKFQYSAPWNKDLLMNFAKQKPITPNDLGEVKGGITPHHLLAGKYIAGFFNVFKKQNPSLVILISPNHFNRGSWPIIISNLDWQTPFGVVDVDKDLVSKLLKEKIVALDNEAMVEEHGIYGPAGILKMELPQTKILPIILKDGASQSKLDKLVEVIYNNLPANAVVVGSIDFSHEKDLETSNINDEYSINLIKNFNYSGMRKMAIDSVPTLYTVMKLMEKLQATNVPFYWHDNSAVISGDLSASSTTSYLLPFFTKK